MAFYTTTPKKLPNFITQEEFEKIFEEIGKQEKKVGKARRKRLRQYRLAVLLGFEAGLRISEILGWKEIPLLTKDMITDNSIRILGKGGKERIVPRPKRMSNKALEMLPLKTQRRALQYYITRLGKEIINKKISFHSLRHGFGSHLAGQGRPVHEIQMLMGHSRLDVTGIYLHSNPKEAIEGAREVF